MFSYERSVSYPDGHRNVIFVQRGIHTLPRLNPSCWEQWPRRAASSTLPTPKCYMPT
jgi:hypothetical protein